ncbi:MAG TPA: tetratricopeptide repeat protein [Terriglobales bacterium]|nr:tetratricopeptide repeat protein [Terriglobales bacterium]
MMVKSRLLLGAMAALILCAAGASFATQPPRKTVREEKLLQIQQLIENHDLESAREQIATAAKRFPKDAGLDNLLGVVAAQEGKYKEAESSFARAVKLDPKFTGAYLNLGRLYQENSAADPEATQKALNIYAKVLTYDPANAEANYQSAVLLLQQKNYRGSLLRLSSLPVEIQNRAQALSVACADYAALSDHSRAEDAAARLTSSPDFSEADLSQMLPALEAASRDDLQIELLKNLQSRGALAPEMQLTLGLAYERTNQFPEARAALEQSVTKKTLSVPLLLELARVAYRQRDYQGALGYLAHAQDLEPKNATLYYYFGFVCVDLNLIAEARNAFEKAVQLDPENPNYNYAMGAASAFRHDPAEAVPYFQKYLKLRPQDPRAKLALGAAFFRAKDYDAAGPWLREAAQTPATATTAHYYLGCIALQQRRLDEARRELEEAVNGSTNYADAWAELGQYYLMQKNYPVAENAIRRALQIDPDHYSANFYLLNLYTRTDDPKREAQAARFEELKKLLDEKTREFLRIIEVRPFEAP